MADPETSGDEKKKKSAVRVHFLLPKGKSKDTCSDDLEEAFEQCDQNNLNPFWITDDKAFTLKPEKTVSFKIIIFNPWHSFISYFFPPKQNLSQSNL